MINDKVKEILDSLKADLDDGDSELYRMERFDRAGHYLTKLLEEAYNKGAKESLESASK